ncbi:MAG TPA: hypothetical protein VHB70_05285, partial [Parafilimonas sp.]|nr:hypothetical protein [Parafilimonas sp.]
KDIISKATNSGSLEFINQPVKNAFSETVGVNVYNIPFSNFSSTNNSSGTAELAVKAIDEKRKRLLDDLEYQKNFLQSVEKKLSNERFVQNAKPEVVELERKKKADAEARIKTLEESLANLA